MEFNLASVVASLGGELHGDPTMVIAGLAPLQMAGPMDLSFLSHPRYQTQLAASRAACVIVSPTMKAVAIARGACIVTDQPYVYFARLTQWWKRHRDGAPQAGVHPSAVVDSDAFVHPSASVGPLCVVEKGASIGAGSVLKSRVHVGAQCAVGERCILHSGVVLGADGFGFALDTDGWEKIEQLGGVRIGNDVEIGANTCVDRGALQDTVIEDGAKLDNLIQVGHNVRIGRHTAIAGCAGVAGSTTIGAYCTIGGGAVILGHLHLADHVHISAATVVSRSIRESGNYTGIYPVEKNAQWEKNAASLKQLHRLRERIRVLENKVNKTERT